MPGASEDQLSSCFTMHSTMASFRRQPVRPKPDMLGSSPSPVLRSLQVWELVPPSHVVPLSDTLGTPDFYPLTKDAPEERMNAVTIESGYMEPNPFTPQVAEFESLRHRFFSQNQTTLQELKISILNSLQNIAWKKQHAKAKEKRQAQQTKKHKVLFPSFSPVANIPEAIKKFIYELATTQEPLNTLKVPQGFILEHLVKSLAENRVPFQRATWMLKVFHLNKYYPHLCGHSSITASTAKMNREASSQWAKSIWNIVYGLISEYFSKSSQRDNRNREKSKYMLWYFLKLLMWTYRDGLVPPELLFDSFCEALKHSTSIPDVEAYLLSVIFQFLPDVCLHQRSLRKLSEYLIGRFDALYKVLESGNVPPMSSRICSMVSTMLKVIALYAADYLVTLNLPAQFFTRLQHVPQMVEPYSTQSSPQQNTQDRTFQEQLDSIRSRINFLQQVATVCNRTVNLISVLDEYEQSLDIESIANMLFDLPDRLLINEAPDPIALTPNRQKSMNAAVRLLLEWCTTSSRTDICRRFVVAAILDKVRAYHPELMPALQSALNSVLDDYEPAGPDGEMVVCRLYAELIRRRLFSRDKYVRSLVSRGILESPDDKRAKIHRIYLEQFPSANNSGIRQNDAFGYDGSHLDAEISAQIRSAIDDYIANIMKSGATQFILHPTDAELERYFFSLSMFHRYYFSYRLLDRVKTILPKYEHTANAKSLLLKQVLLLLESDQQIENVIEFITWLIHCAQSTEYRWLTIPYIYKYHKVWYCRDRLMALLDGLKADNDRTEGETLPLILQLLNLYGNTDAAQVWAKTRKEGLQGKTALERQEMLVNKVDLYIELKNLEAQGTFSQSQTLMPQLTFSRVNEYSIEPAIAFAFSLIADSTSSEHRKKNVALLSHIFSEARRLCNSVSTFDSILVKALTAELTKTGNSVAFALLAFGLLIEHSITWSDIVDIACGYISRIEVPELQESNMPTLIKSLESALELVRFLILDPKFIQNECSNILDHRTLNSIMQWCHCYSPLKRGQLSKLEVLFTCLSILYTAEKVSKYPANIQSCSTLQAKLSDTRSQLSQSWLREGLLCSKNSEIITHLHKHNDVDWFMLSHHVLSPYADRFYPPVVSNVSLETFASFILSKLKQCNDWTLRETWIELQLLLDAWMVVLGGPSTPNPSYTVYTLFADIVALVTILQPQLSPQIEEMLGLLDSAIGREAAFEFIHLLQPAPTSLPFQTVMERLKNNGIELVLKDEQPQVATIDYYCILLQLASITATRACTREELSTVLELLTHQLTELDRFSEDRIQWTEWRRQVTLRVVLIYRILMHARENGDGVHIAAQIKDTSCQLATLLLRLLASSAIQTEALDCWDLWSLVLHTLYELVHESSDELVWSQPIRRALAELDATLTFPAHFRYRIEQVLPFLERREQTTFNANSMRLILPSTVDPWLVLEDQDDSIMLKVFSPKFFERMDLAYA